MEARTKRILGDAFIVTSWCLYVAAFVAIWAPRLPEWIVGVAILLGIVAGHCVGNAWKHHVTGRTSLALRLFPEVS